MTNALSKMLAERDWILADGATGTNLFNMGLMSGDAPELWNEQHPDRIKKLYQSAVDAGSDLFLTNSFGGNASRLKLHDAQHRAHDLSRMAAEIGREVADASGRTVIVAGSVGPTGDIMQPVGTLSHRDAVEIFHEQAEGLKAGGADVLWLETISAPEEYLAAAEAFARADMPWVISSLKAGKPPARAILSPPFHVNMNPDAMTHKYEALFYMKWRFAQLSTSLVLRKVDENLYDMNATFFVKFEYEDIGKNERFTFETQLQLAPLVLD